MSETCKKCGSDMVWGSGHVGAIDHIVDGQTCLHNQLDTEKAKVADLLAACKGLLETVRFYFPNHDSPTTRAAKAAIAKAKAKT